MLLKTAVFVALAVPFAAGAQDDKKTPSLDTDQWLRGELNKSNPKRNFIVAPKLRVTPGARAENFDGKCSIPLVELRPESNSKMKVLPPPRNGHIRVIEPPAPPCDQADRARQ